MEPQQLLLLTVAVIVPLVLLLARQHRALLVWVGVTLFVQVFDTKTLTNLPTGRIVGLFYLPIALATAGQWIRLLAARAWVCNYLYLMLLAVAWGFLWQWPDITQDRPFTQLGPGRSLIYLLRLLSDLSLTVFVARELVKPGALETLRWAMIAGSTLSVLGALVALATGTDLYYAITGLSIDLSEIGRERGLSYEPRGLGMACVYGALLLVLQRRATFNWLALLVLNILGLAIAGSTSASAMFAAGLVSLAIFTGRRHRVLLLSVSGLSVLLVGSLVILFPSHSRVVAEEILSRLDPADKLMGARAQNLGERIAFQLDAFDSSALLFLLNEPLYALTGTGPGLVSLPASYHVPPGIYSLVWTDEVGINTLPTHGPLLELSNSGLLGLGFWWLQFWSGVSALRLLTKSHADRQSRETWLLGHGMFVLGAALYCVQVSISPVWSVFLAIGWSAGLLAGSPARIVPRTVPAPHGRAQLSCLKRRSICLQR